MFLSIQEKLKLEAWWDECDIVYYLDGLCLQSRTLNALVKIILCFILSNFKIFNDIREKNYWGCLLLLYYLKLAFRFRFIVCQNFLLSVTIFTLRLANYFFFSFRNKERQKFLCLEWENRLAVVGYFKSLFLSFGLSIIALEIAFFMNGLLFPRRYFFLGRGTII